jgi:hypothetical protein
MGSFRFQRGQTVSSRSSRAHRSAAAEGYVCGVGVLVLFKEFLITPILAARYPTRGANSLFINLFSRLSHVTYNLVQGP